VFLFIVFRQPILLTTVCFGDCCINDTEFVYIRSVVPKLILQPINRKDDVSLQLGAGFQKPVGSGRTLP